MLRRRKLQQRAPVAQTHTQVRKAEREQICLALLHRPELFRRDRLACRNARGKAGIGGLVPRKESGRLGAAAHLRLGQAAEPERREDMRLLKCAHTRPVAAVIAGVRAVEHDGIPVRSSSRTDRAEDAALAEIAALCRIRSNGVLAQNIHLQLTQRHTERCRQPAGIGARDLRECLLLQMAQMPVNTRPRRLARKILTSYFDEFVKKHYEKLMARLQISEDDFRDAIAEIRHLSPKPGNLYAEGGTDTTPYIIPDFILDYQDGRFNLSLNSYNVPEVRVNRRYMEMIREMVGSDGRVREKDKEAIQFVKNKIDSAKWFISAIKQRHDTLMRTMQTILDYQQEYFKDGDKSKLRPMILKDIADRTGLDVSTISRVVNSKYVQTQFGIILLKSLFSEAMQTDSGEEVSSYEIKNILQQCIDEEDKRRPLTDETLMDILNSKGYRIARRTVAKYREMLGIPVARLRKQI